MRPTLATLAVLAVLAGCASVQSAAGPSAETVAAAHALVDAEPARWPEAAAAVLAIGPDAAAPLVRAVEADRAAPGAQCAVAVLGALGTAPAEACLVGLVEGRSALAAEAALALGRMRSEDAVPVLRSTVSDRTADALARTAAAAALLDLGDDAHAVPFLCAVLVAGTPQGIARRDANGLPDRARWAHERTIVIDAIRRRTGGETFGLDPDLAWPDLARATESFRAAFGAEAPR